MTDPDRKSAIRIEIAPRTLLAVLLVLAAVWIGFPLWTVVIVFSIAVMFAATLDPLVAALERKGLRRGRALALIFASIALVIIAIMLLTVPPLNGQLLHLIEEIGRAHV